MKKSEFPYSIFSVLTFYVTIQVEPNCIAEENMTQNISFLPVQEEAKSTKLLLPFYFAKL